MPDNTEAPRRDLAREINANPLSRESLERAHGQVWDSAELTQDFDVEGFAGVKVEAPIRRRPKTADLALMKRQAPRAALPYPPGAPAAT